MDLSVIIVSRNTCELTAEAVASVFDSRDSFTKEVIVVDNGSTDDTAAVIPRKFPAVKYRSAGANLGFARANNLGAREAAGEFLLLLNSDARPQPDALAIAIDWLRAHPDCGVAGAQLLNPDGTRQNSIANWPTLATELLNKSLLRRLFPRRFPGKEQGLAEPAEVESVVGAFLLTRRRLWETLGGLDERFFFFLEETDFCLQARRTGARVTHLPQVKVWHGQGQTAQQTPIAARIEYWRSRYLYFQKNHGPKHCLTLRAGLLVRLLVNLAANGLAALLTLGLARRCRNKWTEQLALLNWHCKGCPAEMGLRR